jgi:7-cyano-7-deazaguanine synthase
MKTGIILLSGGIDSTTLMAELSKEGWRLHALSFDYGQRHFSELEIASNNASKYNVVAHHLIKMDYNEMSEGNLLTNHQLVKEAIPENGLTPFPGNFYVPGRNLMMLSHAAAYAEAHGLTEIFFGANLDDGERFPDCRPTFFHSLNLLLGSCPNTAKIRINTPFLTLTKSDVVKRSLTLEVDLNQTLSCYSPVGIQECGTCLSCTLKHKALSTALNS